MNDRTTLGISPVYLLSKDLPEDPSVDNYELCMAIAKVIGRGGLLGAQRIGALWCIYTQTLQARATILANGLVMRGRSRLKMEEVSARQRREIDRMAVRQAIRVY